MRNQLLHVYRNTPFGRETLLQSAYFCRQYAGLSLAIYVPHHPRFEMRFESGDVLVFLDKSYLLAPHSAREHASRILDEVGVEHEFLSATDEAAQELPVLPTDFKYMACPRVVSQQSHRIGLGHIGPKVRSIVQHAPFPVLIPSSNYKPWRHVAIFYGPTDLGIKTAELGISVARIAGVPFTIFTQLDGISRQECERRLAQAGLLERIDNTAGRWVVFERGTFEENLFEVPHDALVVVGAGAGPLLKELVFGSHLEKIQSFLPNPLLVTGPHWHASI